MSDMNFPNVTPAAVLAGKCYICHKEEATQDDGIGGKLCPGCHANMRQVVRKHNLSQVGYSPRQKRTSSK